jgi:hypothetical protein
MFFLRCYAMLTLCDRRELHKNESSRIMGENVELIKEINDLRRENRSLKSTQGRDEPGRGNSQELLRELVRLPPWLISSYSLFSHNFIRRCSGKRYGGCGTALTCLRDRVLWIGRSAGRGFLLCKLLNLFNLLSAPWTYTRLRPPSLICFFQGWISRRKCCDWQF